MKKIENNTEAHVDHTRYGMGDYYGTGIKQKVGTIRQEYMGLSSPNPKKMKTPPKSLA